MSAETPKSFDAEADRASAESTARSRLVRIAGVLFCGIGLAVAVLALIRAGQGWQDAGRGTRGGPVVGALAPALPGPARRGTPAPVAAPAPARAEAAPDPAGAPSQAAEATKPAPTAQIAAGPEPLAETPAAASSGTTLVTGAAPPSLPPGPTTALAAPTPASASAVTRPDTKSARTPAGRPEATEPRQFRQVSAPTGSGAGVRAYSLAEGGTVGQDGVRRLVVRVP